MRRNDNPEASIRLREQRFVIRFFIAAIVLALLALLLPVLRAVPQQKSAPPGSIEFEARAMPTGGRAEPVMRLSVSLLRKSFAEIQKEAEQSEEKTDLGKFVDALSVSKELKAWMKRTRSVELSGEEFYKRITTKDIFDVPEFSAAYMARFVAKNLVARGVAAECLVSVAYAIGRAEPLMVEAVDGGGKRLDPSLLAEFDFRPAAIIERLGLRRPIYRDTAAYGHFGRPSFPWESLIL